MSKHKETPSVRVEAVGSYPPASRAPIDPAIRGPREQVAASAKAASAIPEVPIARTVRFFITRHAKNTIRRQQHSDISLPGIGTVRLKREGSDCIITTRSLIHPDIIDTTLIEAVQKFLA